MRLLESRDSPTVRIERNVLMSERDPLLPAGGIELAGRRERERASCEMDDVLALEHVGSSGGGGRVGVAHADFRWAAAATAAAGRVRTNRVGPPATGT